MWGNWNATNKATISRLYAYEHGLSSQLTTKDFILWYARRSLQQRLDSNRPSLSFQAAQSSILQILPGVTDLIADLDFGELILIFDDGHRQPFSNLSDGYRNFLILVGDLARCAATLNPHLKEQAIQDTAGVVLIDELDLHLHPTWQRRVIDDLRDVFPALQHAACFCL